MVNLIETSHVVDLMERYASRPQIDKGLRAAGINRASLDGRKGFVPYAAEAVLIETLARSVGDRHFGARIGGDFDYSAYGDYSSFVLGAPNLAMALDRGGRALVLTHPGSELVVRQTDRHLIVGRKSQGFTVVGHQHLDEGGLLVICRAIQHFLGSDWKPDWVELPQTIASERASLETLVGVPVHVAPVPAIAIRLDDLAVLNPGLAESEPPESLDELAERMDVTPVRTMQDAVMQMLQVSIAGGEPSENSVADLLAINPRTLQRGLKAEGTTFREIRLRLVECQAIRLLSDTDKPLEDIARELGYKEARSFRRVFKERTGFPPSRYRAKARAHND